MNDLRVLLVFMVCATLLLQVSCAKVDLPNQEIPQQQPSVQQPSVQAITDPQTATTDDVADEKAGTPAANDPVIEQPVSDSGTSDKGSLGSAVTRPALSRGAKANPTGTTTLAVERKSSDAARAKGEINFDDLKFDLAKDAPFRDDMLSDEIRQLDGKRVKLRGYILPSTLFSETNISQFVLVRDNQECCFGPGAALFDCVMVQMADGETTDFVTRPVTVEGQFVIDTEAYRYPPGYSPLGATHMAVFRIEGESVE